LVIHVPTLMSFCRDSHYDHGIHIAAGSTEAALHSSLTFRTEQVKRLRYNGQVEHDFHIIWVPRRTLFSDQILEESGVLGEVNVHEYQLYFVPLAEDFLSLELEDAFGDMYLVRNSP
jgi:hypothetical protein